MPCMKVNTFPPARRISDCVAIEIRTYLVCFISMPPSTTSHFDNLCGVQL